MTLTTLGHTWLPLLLSDHGSCVFERSPTCLAVPWGPGQAVGRATNYPKTRRITEVKSSGWGWEGSPRLDARPPVLSFHIHPSLGLGFSIWLLWNFRIALVLGRARCQPLGQGKTSELPTTSSQA